MRKLTPTRTTALVVLAALLITLALALDLTPLLRGGAGWRWPYEVPERPLNLLPGALALLLYLAGGEVWLARLYQTGEPRRRSHILFLIFCLAGGLIVQMAFLAFYGNPFEQLFLRTVSSLSGGFFEVGVTIQNVPDFLRAYPDLMPDWTAHPRAHPPGIVLLFRGSEALFALMPRLSDWLAGIFRPWQCHHRVLMALPDSAISAASLGMALPLIGALAVFPTYDLARRLYDRGTGLRAALWLPLIPSFVMFTPQWNQSFILLTLLGLWLLHRGLAEVRPLYLGLTGMLMSVATFLSFTNVNLIGMLGVYGLVYVGIVGRHIWPRSDWRRIITGSALFIVGLVSVWLIYYLISGVTIFELLSIALTIHYELHEPYLPWLFFFPVDLILFSGLVFSALAGVEIVRSAGRVIGNPREARPDAVLPLTLLICVLGLDVSGLVRGEVARLLLWLMPLVVIVAAHAATTLADRYTDRGALDLALAVQLVVMVGFLRVIGTELAPPPTPPFIAEPPATQFSARAIFGEQQAELIGYDASLSATRDTLNLTLYWRSLERFDHSYFVSAILVGEDGQPAGVNDWLPVEGGYPTSCWRPGEIVIDHTAIPLNAAPSPGNYWLSISLFDFETGERLPVAVPGQAPDTQVGLGPIPIPAATP